MQPYKDVELQYPIERKKPDGSVEEIRSLRIGRLKAKHLRFIPDAVMQMIEQGASSEEDLAEAKVKITDLLPLIGALAGLEDGLIGEIDAETDFPVVASEVMSFLGQRKAVAAESPRTGVTVSGE